MVCQLPVTSSRPNCTHRSNQLAILALGNPLLLESLSLTHLRHRLVANGLLKLLDRQPLHGLAHGIKDTSLMTPMVNNLLGFWFQNKFFAIDLLKSDHASPRQSVNGGLELVEGKRGVGFGGEDGVLFREELEDLERKIPRGVCA